MEFKIGDRVRVRRDVETPYYGWAGITHEDIGVVEELHGGYFLGVHFPDQHEYSPRQWNANPDEMELVATGEEDKEEKKYYKGFRVVDGELKSLVEWDRGVIISAYETCKAPVLTYREGEITYAPIDTQGVFFYDSLDKVRNITRGNGGDKTHKVIHEVIPLGKKSTSKGNFCHPVCHAVLVGKCIEVFNEPESEPVWEDITSKCEVRISLGVTCAWLSLIDPETKGEIFLFGSKGIAPFGQGKDINKYKLEELSTGTYGYKSEGFKVYKRR